MWFDFILHSISFWYIRHLVFNLKSKFQFCFDLFWHISATLFSIWNLNFNFVLIYFHFKIIFDFIVILKSFSFWFFFHFKIIFAMAYFRQMQFLISFCFKIFFIMAYFRRIRSDFNLIWFHLTFNLVLIYPPPCFRFEI